MKHFNTAGQMRVEQNYMVGYVEATPQLVLQGFFQRVVNGGGYINREYGLGRRKVDLMIKWKYNSPEIDIGINREEEKVKYQNIVIELKVIGKKQSYEKVKSEGIIQTAKYAKYCGEKEAQLLIFDRDRSQKWGAEEKNELVEHDGMKIEIWKLGCGEED
ncbi:MAG: hypothetical protein FWG98_13010 [Candidatus Cloacimonetes bacterium]|nr:hypothetical protein [Candidatus Cloacimonadota bacterium]